MGQSVDRVEFGHQAVARFTERLRAETQLLHDWVERNALSSREPVTGLELEAWLIDAQGHPAPRNEEFLARLGCPDVVTELGRFNIELNVPPAPVAGDGLLRLSSSLQSTWSQVQACAAEMGLQAVAIGILPTLRDADLQLANLSDRARYRALNQQALRQRHGRAVSLDIEGPDGRHLRSTHRDVMLEAAATSFQVHLQVPADRMVRVFNAAQVCAAPLLALCGNSPLLFGQPLWQESRIPVFEQALGLGTWVDGAHASLSRVSLGSGYAGYSLVECFRENCERFEPLLPMLSDEPAERLPHLRLHNGTIWRWNRPIVGFDPDGQPHLRLEHRPLPAGPSLVDMMANLSLALGLFAGLAEAAVPPESQLPFEAASQNFQLAARHGLEARLQGLGQTEITAREWLQDLLPVARAGLDRLGVSPEVADAGLSVAGDRLRTRRTGAHWQIARLALRRGDLAALTLDYAQRQSTGEPVHTWS